MNKIEYTICRILSSIMKYGGYLELEIENKLLSETALPGNFVMIKGWPGDSPIFSRPFDILEPSPERKSFKLVIKLIGGGTRRLAELKPGDEVSILGPLGRSVEVPARTREGKAVTDIGLLVRGVGAAAVVLLAEKAKSAGVRVHTFVTAATEEKLVCRDYLANYSDSLLSGWDGSSGNAEHGNKDRIETGAGNDGRDLVTAFLKKDKFDLLYTCGSKRFGRFVQELDREGIADGYLFMESRMACGLGDCHGCTVETPEGEYLLVCQDGPVFPAGRIKL